MKTLLLKLDNRYLNLMLSLGFALLLFFVRVKITHSIFYGFLVWNLFLAAVPYFITQLMAARLENRSISGLFFVLGFMLWLLFLPNSPYIITDLVHLHDDNSNLIWFDLFLVFVFACNGLLLGLLSLIDMRRILLRRYSVTFTFLTLFVVCMLSGYGIYVGRFLRFNSWDIATKPYLLFEQMLQSLQQPKVWAMTLAFGGFLWILFMLFQSVRKKEY